MQASKRIALPKEIKEKNILIPLRDIGLDYLGIVLSIAQYGYFQNIVSLIAAIILTGIFIYRLQIIGHDGLHYALAENKSVNDFITRYILLSPQFTPMSLNRTNHLNHHGKFATSEDADWQYYQASDKNTKSKFYMWWANVIGFGFVFKIAHKLLFGKKTDAIQKKAANNKLEGLMKDFMAFAITQLIILTIFYFTLGWMYYFIIWVVAVFGVFIPLNTIRSFCEHSIPEPDDSATNRLYTFESNFLESFIIAPHNMNYHYEHHEYMYVPYYQLPQLKKLLMQADNGYVEHIRLSYWSHIKYFFSHLPILSK
ncbi:MAG: fatty acid desaturase [Bacteroidota bacterium]